MAIAVGCVVLVLCGCGSHASVPQRRDANAPNVAQEVVRAYVTALNSRNTGKFCGLLAPWMRARVGALVKGGIAGPSGAQTPEAKLCREGARFIGYTGENVPTEWVRADIVSLAPRRTHGAVAAFDMTVRNHFKRTIFAGRSHSDPPATLQKDRVYLVRIGEEWRVAKLSAVADTASIGLADTTPALAPPDIPREQAWYRARLAVDARYRHQARETSAPYTDCSSVGRVKAFRDAVDDVTPNLRVPARGRRTGMAARPGDDIRSVAVARSRETFCADFEAAGAVAPGAQLAVLLEQPGRADLASGLVIQAELKGPGDRVLSLSYPGADDSPGSGAVDGEIGVRGNRLSIVLKRDRVPATVRGVFNHFTWGASSTYIPPQRPTRDGDVMFIDDVPNSQARNIPYP